MASVLEYPVMFPGEQEPNVDDVIEELRIEFVDALTQHYKHKKALNK